MTTKNNKAICAIPGCNEPVAIRGLCKIHYSRWHCREYRTPAIWQIREGGKTLSEKREEKVWQIRKSPRDMRPVRAVQ